MFTHTSRYYTVEAVSLPTPMVKSMPISVDDFYPILQICKSWQK